jgi:parallel beta-helix repeat protein
VENFANIVVAGNNFDRNPRYAVNGFAGAENNGIRIRNSSEVSLTGNVVSGVLRKPAAVQVLECSRILINSNSIVDSDGSGLLLQNVSDSILNGNMVSDDRAPDVRSPAAPISVAGGSENLIGTNLIREK